MVKQLLEKAIKENNSFIGKTNLELMIKFFFTTGKITQEEHDELINLLNPIEQTPTE